MFGIVTVLIALFALIAVVFYIDRAYPKEHLCSTLHDLTIIAAQPATTTAEAHTLCLFRCRRCNFVISTVNVGAWTLEEMAMKERPRALSVEELERMAR